MTQSAFSGVRATVLADPVTPAAMDVETVGWAFNPTLDVGEHVSDKTGGNVTTVEGAKNFTATVTVKVPKSSSGYRLPWKNGDEITVKFLADGGAANDYIQADVRVTEQPLSAANATPDGLEVPYTLRPRGADVIYSGIFCPDATSSSCVW